MGQVIVRGDGQWTNDQLNEMVKRLGEDTEIAVSRRGKVIAVRFSFKAGASYGNSAEQHVRKALDGLMEVNEVHYADERFMHAWD